MTASPKNNEVPQWQEDFLKELAVWGGIESEKLKAEMWAMLRRHLRVLSAENERLKADGERRRTVLLAIKCEAEIHGEENPISEVVRLPKGYQEIIAMVDLLELQPDAARTPPASAKEGA